MQEKQQHGRSAEHCSEERFGVPAMKEVTFFRGRLAMARIQQTVCNVENPGGEKERSSIAAVEMQMRRTGGEYKPNSGYGGRIERE
jgi:hypothetical protein